MGTISQEIRQNSQRGAMDLSVIIVNWNVRDHLRRCLGSIDESARQGRGARLHLEVVVVDNASSDGSPAMVRQEFPAVGLLESPHNLGYAAGVNSGAAQAQGRYLLLLNPDTEVVGDALGEMVDYLEGNPQVGALGPQLLDSRGAILSSRRRFPTLTTAFVESTVWQQWRPQHPALRAYYVLDRADDEIQEVDWLVGACLLIRRSAWEEVGPLDQDFFMYSEELDWCYRARGRGWMIVYYPQARVVHHEGKSSEQAIPLRHIHFQRSKLHFFRKHHGRWRAELLRWFLLANYGYQLVLEAIKGVLGHKRPLRQQRLRAYWLVLRSGLK